MAEMRLEDLWYIIRGLVIIFVCLVGGRFLWALRSQIAMLCRAFWARNFNRDWWENVVEWIADQGSSVSTYGEPGAGARQERSAPAHMSTEAHRPEYRIVAVPSTATKETVPAVPTQDDLTYDEAVRQAASIKVNGKWFMSGKKLYSIVGGNHKRFLEIVSEVRGDPSPDDLPAAPPNVAPVSGRPIPANVVFHSDDPALEYQPPNC